MNYFLFRKFYLNQWFRLLVLIFFLQWSTIWLPCSSHATVKSSPQKVVFLGDSITEGYGVPKDKSFPILVEQRLKIDGYNGIEVINAGISGSTSASGESRLRWYLRKNPDIVVLALGANDGLRGIPVEQTKNNLEKVIILAQKKHVQILLAGMQMPPNYGQKYTLEYKKLFFDLARSYRLPMIPFLLKGVAGKRELNQEDGIHPNELGHEKIADLVLPLLEKVLSK